MDVGDKIGITIAAVGSLIDATETLFPGAIGKTTATTRKTVFAVGTVLVILGLAIMYLSPSSTTAVPNGPTISSQRNNDCNVSGSGNRVNCGQETSAVETHDPSISVTASAPCTNIGQSGGTANFHCPINEVPKPPKPKLRTISETQTDNPDGTYAFSRTVAMNAPYAGHLIFLIRANNLIRANVASTVARRIEIPGNTLIITGADDLEHMPQNEIMGSDYYSITFPKPHDQYLVTVTAKQKVPVEINTKFQ